jgi:hypothetical protein
MYWPVEGQGLTLVMEWKRYGMTVLMAVPPVEESALLSLFLLGNRKRMFLVGNTVVFPM